MKELKDLLLALYALLTSSFCVFVGVTHLDRGELGRGIAMLTISLMVSMSMLLAIYFFKVRR